MTHPTDCTCVRCHAINVALAIAQAAVSGDLDALDSALDAAGVVRSMLMEPASGWPAVWSETHETG